MAVVIKIKINDFGLSMIDTLRVTDNQVYFNGFNPTLQKKSLFEISTEAFCDESFSLNFWKLIV